MDIESKVRELLGKCVGTKVPVEQIGPEDDLFLVGMNSANSVDLVVAIEEEFGFEFADGDLTPRNLRSIASIAAYIQGRLK
jgi:acyl carrier protein